MIKYLNYILIVLVVILLFSVKRCSTVSKEMKQSVKNFTTVVEGYQIDSANNSMQMASMSQIIVKSNSEIADLKIEKNSLMSKINSQVKTKFVTRIEEVEVIVNRTDTVAIFGGISAFGFENSTEWWKLRGYVKYNGNLIIETMETYHEFSATLGLRKRTFKTILKKREPILMVQDANPNTNILSLENIVIKNNLPKLTHGVQAGIGITSRGVLPYFGYGLSINF